MQLLEAGISSKIMKVALCQQKALSDEENVETNSITAVFSAASALNAEEEKRVIWEEEDDIDDFDGKFDDDSYHVSAFTLSLQLFFFIFFVSVLNITRKVSFTQD